MSLVTVRLALVCERESLEALQWRASLNNPNDRDALMANPDAIVLPAQQILDGGVFVAEEAERIRGFAAILPRPDGDAELDALFVEPACSRRGIGRLLVEHCVTAAREAGAAYLHVIGNPEAEHFYGVCGFRQVATVRTRFGVGLDMKKALH